MLDWDTVVWVRRWANKFNLRIQFSLFFFVGRCVMYGIKIATTNRQMNFVEIVSGEIMLSWNLDNFMSKRVLYYIKWFTLNRNEVTSTQWSTDKDFRWNYTCTLFLGVWDWFGSCLVQLLSFRPCRIVVIRSSWFMFNFPFSFILWMFLKFSSYNILLKGLHHQRHWNSMLVESKLVNTILHCCALYFLYKSFLAILQMSNIFFEWIWQSYFEDETKPVGSIWIGSRDFFLPSKTL